MMAKFGTGWIATVAVLAWSLLGGGHTASAHHSDAMFDKTKQITITGTVKSFEWTNPHVWLQVLDDSGKEVGFEAVSPNTMVRDGWRWNSLKTGDKVSVTGNPRIDRQSGGFLIQVVKADGTKLGGRLPGPLGAGAPPSP